MVSPRINFPEYSHMSRIWTELRELALIGALLLLVNGASVGLAVLIAMTISPT
jgi:hypothetical protein